MSQAFKVVSAPLSLGFGRSPRHGIMFTRRCDGMWDRRRFGKEIWESLSRCPFKLENTILEKRLQYNDRLFEMVFVNDSSMTGLSA